MEQYDSVKNCDYMIRTSQNLSQTLLTLCLCGQSLSTYCVSPNDVHRIARNIRRGTALLCPIS
jgi:hypothetical protein